MVSILCVFLPPPLYPCSFLFFLVFLSLDSTHFWILFFLLTVAVLRSHSPFFTFAPTTFSPPFPPHHYPLFCMFYFPHPNLASSNSFVPQPPLADTTSFCSFFLCFFSCDLFWDSIPLKKSPSDKEPPPSNNLFLSFFTPSPPFPWLLFQSVLLSLLTYYGLLSRWSAGTFLKIIPGTLDNSVSFPLFTFLSLFDFRFFHIPPSPPFNRLPWFVEWFFWWHFGCLPLATASSPYGFWCLSLCAFPALSCCPLFRLLFVVYLWSFWKYVLRRVGPGGLPKRVTYDNFSCAS